MFVFTPKVGRIRSEFKDAPANFHIWQRVIFFSIKSRLSQWNKKKSSSFRMEMAKIHHTSWLNLTRTHQRVITLPFLFISRIKIEKSRHSIRIPQFIPQHSSYLWKKIEFYQVPPGGLGRLFPDFWSQARAFREAGRVSLNRKCRPLTFLSDGTIKQENEEGKKPNKRQNSLPLNVFWLGATGFQSAPLSGHFHFVHFSERSHSQKWTEIIVIFSSPVRLLSSWFWRNDPSPRTADVRPTDSWWPLTRSNQM